MLEHQRQPLERRGLTQPSHQQRRRDIIGQIGDYLPWCRHQRGEIDRPRIAFEHPQPTTGGFGQLHHRADRPAVELDRDDVSRLGGQQ